MACSLAVDESTSQWGGRELAGGVPPPCLYYFAPTCPKVILVTVNKYELNIEINVLVHLDYIIKNFKASRTTVYRIHTP